MPRSLTLEEWVRRCKKVHGEKYDYSESVYVNMVTKIRIKCPIHGIFEQWPQHHFNKKSGCPDCAHSKRSDSIGKSWEKRKRTTEDWIEDARKIHGDKYIYTNVEYVNSRQDVKIICPEHGLFSQNAGSHLAGRGCKLCGIIKNTNSKSIGTEEWIKRARKIHGAKYRYHKTKYVNAHTNVVIECPIHGEFEQLPTVHLRSHGCGKCGQEISLSKRRISMTDFLERAEEVHGSRYDYSEVMLTNTNTKVKIICKTHGPFFQSPDLHLNRGYGCGKCDGKGLSTEDWIERFQEIHGEKYDYSKFSFVTSKTPSIIICSLHGEFLQRPSGHLRGSGCTKCAYEKSRLRKRDHLVPGFNSMGREEFIRRSRVKYQNKFDYSQVVYVNSKTPVTIICPVHGEFTQSPSVHFSSIYGCKNCIPMRTYYTKETWVEASEKKHNKKFDYSLVQFEIMNEKVTIICPHHGKFEQLAGNHLSGIGCKKCHFDWLKSEENTMRLSKEDVIELCKTIHGNYYDYSLVVYVNSKTPMKIICPEHGEFEQSFALHYHQRCGCNGCAKHGFDEFAPAFYYVHEILNEIGDILFIKGGISNNPKERFRRWSSSIKSMERHRNHTTRVSRLAWFENGQDALHLEKLLLAEEDIRMPKFPNMDGGTELFSEDPLLYAMDVLDLADEIEIIPADY